MRHQDAQAFRGKRVEWRADLAPDDKRRSGRGIVSRVTFVSARVKASDAPNAAPGTVEEVTLPLSRVIWMREA